MIKVSDLFFRLFITPRIEKCQHSDNKIEKFRQKVVKLGPKNLRKKNGKTNRNSGKRFPGIRAIISGKKEKFGQNNPREFRAKYRAIFGDVLPEFPGDFSPEFLVFPEPGGGGVAAPPPSGSYAYEQDNHTCK